MAADQASPAAARKPAGREYLALLSLFGQLALRPASGLAAVQKADPNLTAIAVALGFAGLARGVAEGLWYYLMTGQARQLPALLGRPDWYMKYGGPFLSVVSTAGNC